jgi:hypothetical protein
VDQKLIAIEASHEFMEKLTAAAADAGLEHSKPVGTESLADPLDAPIGGEELKNIVEIVTVLFKAGAAAVTFFGAIKSVLKSAPEQSVVVKDPATGKKIGELRADMSEAEMKQVVGV